ncbi:MAG: hypothetical protein C0410_11350 [Anaerolinea sp.]|nr:hypothetical protein [Anaerolinea sp.]
MKSMKPVKEATIFLGLTLALSWFVFWGPLALFKIPAISFVSNVRGPIWAIILFILGGFVPSLTALFLVWRKEGKQGIHSLLRRIVQFKLGWRWYGFSILFVIVGTAGFLIINKLLGHSFDGRIFITQLGNFLPLLILGPLSEELGWRGYALERLQTRWNALTSSLIIGVVWALWHLPLFFMMGTSQHELALPFFSFMLKILATSILYTWIFNNTQKNLWSAIFFHWIWTYASQVVDSGVTHSPLYNWFECLPYVTIAGVVVLIWKPWRATYPLGKTTNNLENPIRN